jgi:hypothetical protein
MLIGKMLKNAMMEISTNGIAVRIRMGSKCKEIRSVRFNG